MGRWRTYMRLRRQGRVVDPPRVGEESLVSCLSLGNALCSSVPCIWVVVAGSPFRLCCNPALDDWVEPPAELHNDGVAFSISCSVKELLELVDILLYGSSPLIVVLGLQSCHGSDIFVQGEELLLKGVLEGLPGFVPGRAHSLFVCEGLVGKGGRPCCFHEREPPHDPNLNTRELGRAETHVKHARVHKGATFRPISVKVIRPGGCESSGGNEGKDRRCSRSRRRLGGCVVRIASKKFL